jgi:hypothetical protein
VVGLFGWLVGSLLFSVRTKYLRFVGLGCVYACFGWLAGLESRAARCMGVAVGWCLLDLDGNGNGEWGMGIGWMPGVGWLGWVGSAGCLLLVWCIRYG